MTVLERALKLTGRTRVRRGWFGRLVLQVEYWDTDGAGPELWNVRRWRDARTTDLTPLAVDLVGKVA